MNTKYLVAFGGPAELAATSNPCCDAEIDLKVRAKRQEWNVFGHKLAKRRLFITILLTAVSH